MSNPYCEALGIEVPVLDRVVGMRLVAGGKPTVFGLFVVALLERGGPMTLEEAAARMQRAGVGPRGKVLQALRRSRPARTPVYRDGDDYGLDLHADELDLITFSFGLRPPRVKKPPSAPPPPRPPSHQRLTVAELDEGWRGSSLSTWSQQRIALAVLDAHGEPMPPRDVVAFVAARTEWFRLPVDGESFRRGNPTVRLREDGLWEIARPEALPAVRDAVRDRVDMVRRYRRSSAADIEASMKAADRRREEHAAALAELRRVIVHAFPISQPVAAVLVDVDARRLYAMDGDELAAIGKRMAAYDVLAGIDIRPLLRGLGVDPGARRVADLAPPQQSVSFGPGSRSLRLTTAMLVQGSCRIKRPLAAEADLERYRTGGQTVKLVRRLEADARALLSFYQYGRTHGAVRLRWGPFDELMPVPWVYRDEYGLHDLKYKAHAVGTEIEAVVGEAPSWEEPWARLQLCRVLELREHDLVLADEDGFLLDDRDVQVARLAATIH